jgi:iron complex outermembrane receptor protein
MQSIFKTVLFLCIFGMSAVQASKVNALLNAFSHKNDLSQKTIDENKGHLILFSRDKLERMHAKTLKDVFKTTPAIYYHENRYGLPDPLTSGAFEPYRSNFIRLYVDGVEVTQGWFGSGLILYGDMNIDFVDHIEFYYAVPSFESAVEPTYLTVFLYSKDVKRDNGGKLSLLQGSRGHGAQSIQYGEEKEDYAYMVNFSHTHAKREKIDNGTKQPLSRDFERTQLMAYVKTDDEVAHLQVMKKETDSLAGFSLDATPLVSQIDFLNVHMDYGIDFLEHWRAQFSYEWLKSDFRQEDNTPLLFSGVAGFGNRFYGTFKNSTYSGELSYKNTFGKHRIMTGLKARRKRLDSLNIETLGDRPLDFSRENILTAFLQDQYRLGTSELLTSELLTLGASYSKIYRDAEVDDDALLQLRLGYIYTTKHWSYKAYLYRTMFALDPFSRYINLTNINAVPAQVTKGITQEISYQEEDYRVRLMILMMKDKDGLVQNGGRGNTKYFFSILNYDYEFDKDNVLNLQFYYAQYKDIFSVKQLDDYSGYLSLSNSYDKFDFYNGVVWHKNSINHKNYLDLTSTITWNVNEDLTFTIKGQNLLNDAKKSTMLKVSPSTGDLMQPLSISPIDQRVTLEVEYTF